MTVRSIRPWFTGETNGLSIVIEIDDVARCGTCGGRITYNAYDDGHPSFGCMHCTTCKRWRKVELRRCHEQP